MDVVLVRWPEESEHLAELRAAAVPRLLLVGPTSDPPASTDPLEDWVRLPAEDRDVRARVATLEARTADGGAAPTLDDDGLLRLRDRWVSLSPVERLLAGALVDRFGAVVGREALSKHAWPDGAPTRNALDVHILRLRRRIAELGLEIRTVRSRGYLLQASAGGRAGLAS
ncbi:MAG: winged helix-turn-helix domain-containing protein [Actinomycetes bacterium]